jgi:uncharacterized membrane protein
MQVKTRIKEIFPYLGALLAATFGLGECIRMTWLEYGGNPLPCRSNVCLMLEKDPLSHPLGVPMPLIGIAYYAALVLGLCVWMVLDKRLVKVFTVTVSTLGALISIGLVSYTFMKAHGFCPWCTASAIASVIAFALLLLIERPLPKAVGARSLAAGLPLGLALAMGLVASLERAERDTGLDLGVLGSLSVAQLYPPNRNVAPSIPTAKKRLVMFADLGCGTCRRTLRELREKGLGLNTDLRFVKPMTDYGREAALTYLSAKTDAERTTVISEVLEDDSRTIEPLLRLRTRMGIDSGMPDAIRSLLRDNELADRLHIEAAPVLIEWKGQNPQPTTLSDAIAGA